MDGKEKSELEEFRLKWQEELTRSQAASPRAHEVTRNVDNSTSKSLHEDRSALPNKRNKRIPAINQPTLSDVQTIEITLGSCSTDEKARHLFTEGVKYERSGKLVEAIRFYKRAVQLDSDVERRIYEEPKRQPVLEDVFDHVEEDAGNLVQDLNENEDDVDLSNLIGYYQKLSLIDRRVCLPQTVPQDVHISALPAELIIYILKWVVSVDLDLRSLEQTARVCRGFYLCCRDEEIWKLACHRVWGSDCGSPARCGYQSWRLMYIERPRLQFNGCYISKTSYVRPGENSFQDANYQPWHFIQYFRYLRFLPGGVVLMLTTSEEPSTTVPHLRNRSTALTSHPSMLQGHYMLKASMVYIILKRAAPQTSITTTTKYRRRGRDVSVKTEQGEQSFEMELELKPHKKKKNVSLHWVRYIVRTSYPAGPQGPVPESVTSFPIIPNKFPVFWFSRVRSYTAEAECAL